MASASLVRQSIFRAVGTSPLLRVNGVAPGLMLAQRRFVSTQKMSPEDSIALLNSQREKRPTSPHLTIYQPQMTWVPSGLNRITGVALSGLLYGGSILYLLHPVFPAIDSAHLIQMAADLPTWFKSSVKLVLAAPFFFHSYNGLRHLMWDWTTGLTIKSVYATGYTVIAATVISSIYVAFFL